MTTTSASAALDLLSSGDVTGALPALREAAFRAPSYSTYVNYGIALRCAANFDAALAILAKAVTLDPAPPNAYLALGNVSSDLGEWSHALGYYEAAFSRVAVHDTSHTAAARQIAIAYAQALLRAHRFTEAWPLWELGRFERSYFALPGTKRWLGAPTKSLLVVPEGGYGDAMQFSRWLPFAKSRAKHLALLVWDKMADFRDWQALGVDSVLLKSMPLDPALFEYTTSWLSLPAIAGMKSIADIPRDGLLADSTPERMRIGFAWRAEEAGQLRRTRSLSAGEAGQLAAVLSNYGVVTSLILSSGALYGSRDFEVPDGVLQQDALLDGWHRTARTICACRFVVTVDTAIAHLAGLCGVPTLLLLACASDYRWGTAANQPVDPWYGPHLHYFRNPDPLHWDVAQIAEEIRHLSSTGHLG